MTGTIYIIKNTKNNIVYVGQTILSVEDRFKQHMKPSMHKRNYKLYKAIEKIGREHFYYEILEENIPIELLNKKEIEYIEKYNSFKHGYNSTKGGDGRLINKVEDLDYIISELENGKYSTDIAKELGISTATIKRALKKVNIKPSDFRKVDKEAVKEMYLKGVPRKEISRILKINEKTISRTINELGVPKRHSLKDLSTISKEEMYELYANGMSYKEISEKYNLNYSYVARNCLKIKKSKRNSIDYPVKE